jgi:hypothetical protein
LFVVVCLNGKRSLLWPLFVLYHIESLFNYPYICHSNLSYESESGLPNQATTS